MRVTENVHVGGNAPLVHLDPLCDLLLVLLDLLRFAEVRVDCFHFQVGGVGGLHLLGGEKLLLDVAIGVSDQAETLS